MGRQFRDIATQIVADIKEFFAEESIEVVFVQILETRETEGMPRFLGYTVCEFS